MTINEAREIVEQYGKPCYCKSQYDSDEYAKATGFLEGYEQGVKKAAEIPDRVIKDYSKLLIVPCDEREQVKNILNRILALLETKVKDEGKK